MKLLNIKIALLISVSLFLAPCTASGAKDLGFDLYLPNQPVLLSQGRQCELLPDQRNMPDKPESVHFERLDFNCGMSVVESPLTKAFNPPSSCDPSWNEGPSYVEKTKVRATKILRTGKGRIIYVAAMEAVSNGTMYRYYTAIGRTIIAVTWWADNAAKKTCYRDICLFIDSLVKTKDLNSILAAAKAQTLYVQNHLERYVNYTLYLPTYVPLGLSERCYFFKNDRIATKPYLFALYDENPWWMRICPILAMFCDAGVRSINLDECKSEAGFRPPKSCPLIDSGNDACPVELQTVTPCGHQIWRETKNYRVAPRDASRWVRIEGTLVMIQEYGGQLGTPRMNDKEWVRFVDSLQPVPLSKCIKAYATKRI